MGNEVAGKLGFEPRLHDPEPLYQLIASKYVNHSPMNELNGLGENSLKRLAFRIPFWIMAVYLAAEADYFTTLSLWAYLRTASSISAFIGLFPMCSTR